MVKECETRAGAPFKKLSGKSRGKLPAKLSRTKTQSFQRTNILQDDGKGGRLCRVYRDPFDDGLALYSELYLNFLGSPEAVYAEGVNGVAVDDPAPATWWLMPVRMGEGGEVILSLLDRPEPQPAPQPEPEPAPQPEPVKPEESIDRTAKQARARRKVRRARRQVARQVNQEAVDAAVGGEVRQSGSWLWARFPSRPSDETRERMKAAGWRWSRRRSEWYLRPQEEPKAA